MKRILKIMTFRISLQLFTVILFVAACFHLCIYSRAYATVCGNPNLCTSWSCKNGGLYRSVHTVGYVCCDGSNTICGITWVVYGYPNWYACNIGFVAPGSSRYSCSPSGNLEVYGDQIQVDCSDGTCIVTGTVRTAKKNCFSWDVVPIGSC